jgi:hypothetical protein
MAITQRTPSIFNLSKTPERMQWTQRWYSEENETERMLWTQMWYSKENVMAVWTPETGEGMWLRLL